MLKIFAGRLAIAGSLSSRLSRSTNPAGQHAGNAVTSLDSMLESIILTVQGNASLRVALEPDSPANNHGTNLILARPAANNSKTPALNTFALVSVIGPALTCVKYYPLEQASSLQRTAFAVAHLSNRTLLVQRWGEESIVGRSVNTRAGKLGAGVCLLLRLHPKTLFFSTI